MKFVVKVSVVRVIADPEGSFEDVIFEETATAFRTRDEAVRHAVMLIRKEG